MIQQSPYNLSSTQHKKQNYPQFWCFPFPLLLQMTVEENVLYQGTQLRMRSGSKWWSINHCSNNVDPFESEGESQSGDALNNSYENLKLLCI